MSRSSLQRLGSALCGTLLVCLFGVGAADASPSHARVAPHKLCSARPAACRAKARVSNRSRQPVPYFVRVQRVVHRQTGSTWLERSRPDPLRQYDDATLQNRTPLSGEDDLLPLASLEPLGVLSSPLCPITISTVVARHPPRGPPRLLRVV